MTNVQELNCQESLRKDVHEVSSANGQAVSEMVFRHHRLPFKPEDFDLTEKFNIPKESVEDMFRKACDLLDLPNSITKIASMDECVRSVQSDGVSPLTVPPSSKNRDLLLCACKTHCLLEVCHHTLASSADIGISFHYILEVAKKLELKKKNKNETPLFSNA